MQVVPEAGCTDQACDVKFFLANSEPSTHGTFCRTNRAEQIAGTPADRPLLIRYPAIRPLPSARLKKISGASRRGLLTFCNNFAICSFSAKT